MALVSRWALDRDASHLLGPRWRVLEACACFWREAARLALGSQEARDSRCPCGSPRVGREEPGGATGGHAS